MSDWRVVSGGGEEAQLIVACFREVEAAVHGLEVARTEDDAAFADNGQRPNHAAGLVTK